MSIIMENFNQQINAFYQNSVLERLGLKTSVENQTCPHSASEIGAFFKKLQVDTNNPPPPNFESIWRNRKVKLPKLFKFRQVEWEGKTKADSVKKAFLTLKKSTRDRYGLSREFLENFSAEYTEILCEMVNTSLILGTYLKEWRMVRLVPIPKRPPFNLKKNWRPISVASIIAILIEKIATAQLAEYLEEMKILSDSQHGFRKNRSCTTAITALLNSIYKGHKRQKITVMVDGKNAFGSVSHEKILKNLATFCDYTTLFWFFNFLTDRSFVTEVNGERSETFDLPNSSVNQGSGPAPALFSLSFDTVLTELDSMENILCFCFADDLLISVGCDTVAEAQEKVAEIGHLVIAKMKQKADIQCAPGKTEIIRFGESDEKHKFSLGGVEIEESEKVRYLGYKLDRKLTSEPHIAYLAARFVSNSHKAEKMAAYGNPRQCARHLVAMCDGLFSHGTAGLKLPYRKIARLEKIRNKGLKMVLGLKLYEERVIKMTQTDLLRRAGNLNSLYNTHRYNVVCLISRVWETGTPESLYRDMRDFLQSNQGPVFEPAKASSLGREWQRDAWSEYIFDLRRGEYEVKLDFPPNVSSRDRNRTKMRKIWPLNNAEIFNELPGYLRNRVGLKCFPLLAKKYFDSICQHPGSKKVCKECETPDFDLLPPVLELSLNQNLSEIEQLTIDTLLYDTNFRIHKRRPIEIRQAVEGLMYEVHGILVDNDD